MTDSRSRSTPCRWTRAARDDPRAAARRASGWSPTASAATPPAPSPASPRAAITACWSPRCRRRSAASMMLNHLGERAPPARRHASSRSAARSAPSGRSSCRRRHLARVPPRDGLPVWRYRGRRRRRSRSASSLPHAQNTVHVDLPAARRATAGAPRAAPVACTSAPHDAPVVDAARRAVHADRRASDRYEVAAPAPTCPPLRLHAARARRRRSRSTPRDVAGRLLPRRGSAAATSRAGDAVEPGLLPRRPRRRRATCTLVASTETLGDDRRARRRDEALRGRARAPPRGCSTQRRPARAQRRRPPSWCWPPTSSSSRPPAASRTPRARAPPATRCARVIAGYHWFTDWGRDTMISLEGLTLAHRPPRARPATSCAPSRTTCATA